MLKYIPYRISLNKVIIISNQANTNSSKAMLIYTFKRLFIF